MRLLLAVLLTVCGSSFGKPFHVFAWNGAQTPSPITRLDQRMFGGTSWFFFKWNGPTLGYDYSKVDVDRVKKTALEHDNKNILIIDIENFKNDAYGNAQLQSVVDIIRTNNPAIRMGFYAEWPKQEYWGRVPAAQDREKIAKGQEPTRYQVNLSNERLVKQADDRRFGLTFGVDVVTPSCYTHYRTANTTVAADPLVRDWELYCRAQITEAKKANKQIIVFLWPVYHDSTEANVKLVEGEYFRRQLDLVYNSGADGIALYEGLLKPEHYAAPWRQQLDAFMNSKGLP